MRRNIVVVLRIVVSVAIVGYLLTQIDLPKLIDVWRGIILPFFILALALQIVGVLISSLKWWLLLRAAGDHVPYNWTVRVYLVGQFFSNFLPTMIGGDAVRVYHATQRTGHTANALASVFVERLTGFVALTIIAWFGLALSADVLAGAPEIFWSALWCVLAATVALGMAIAAPWLARLVVRVKLPDVLKWRSRLQHIAQTIATYASHRRTMVAAMLLSFAYQFTWIAINTTIAYALGLRVPFSFMALMVPLSDIIGLVPIFFNSLGAREGVFVLLLGQIGVATEIALGVSFLMFISRILVSLLGGVFYMLGGLSAPTMTTLPPTQTPNAHK